MRLNWIDYLPRPERSGTIGAIMLPYFISLCLSLGTGGFSLKCFLPFVCIGVGGNQQVTSEPSEWRDLDDLILSPAGSGKAPVCSCHRDYLSVRNGNMIMRDHEGIPYKCPSNAMQEALVKETDTQTYESSAGIITDTESWHCSSDWNHIGEWITEGGGDSRVWLTTDIYTTR